MFWISSVDSMACPTEESGDALIASGQLAVLAGPSCLRAQLVLENPHQRWTPGAVIELILRDPDIKDAEQIDAVLFDQVRIEPTDVSFKVTPDFLFGRFRVLVDQTNC